jgi:hypothetical protein
VRRPAIAVLQASLEVRSGLFGDIPQRAGGVGRGHVIGWQLVALVRQRQRLVGDSDRLTPA